MTANAGRVQASLQIKQGNLQYQNRPGSFSFAMQGTNGPTPGAVTCGVGHTVINLSQLDVPGGMCRVLNTDLVNFVTLGIYSSHFNEFFPFMDLLPGEEYVFRLSRFIGQDLHPGTGTGGTGFTNQLAVKADVAPVVVVVEAFDF